MLVCLKSIRITYIVVVGDVSVCVFMYDFSDIFRRWCVFVFADQLQVYLSLDFDLEVLVLVIYFLGLLTRQKLFWHCLRDQKKALCFCQSSSWDQKSLKIHC